MNNQFRSNGGGQNIAQGSQPIGQQNNYGIPPEIFAQYVRELGATEQIISGFLSILLEYEVPREQWDSRLREIATKYKEMLAHFVKAKNGYEVNRISPDQQAQLMAAVLGLIENQNKLIDKIPSSRELAMGDTYNIHGGQIGAIGQSASASGNTFQQITAELSRLHEEMQRSAKTPEQRAAADDVAKAAQAAQQQNKPTVRQHLKNAGKFALDCAQKIGAEALAEYLKKMTLGL